MVKSEAILVLKANPFGFVFFTHFKGKLFQKPQKKGGSKGIPIQFRKQNIDNNVKSIKKGGNLMSLTGKVALVTASTRGIGLAIVERLAQEGATVYMAARRTAYADEIAAQLNSKGGHVASVYFDAYDGDCYKTMIDTVVQKEGKIDILVNNFGTSDTAKDLTISNTDYETFQSIINVNLESVFRASQNAIAYMEKNGGGSIINISSIAGQVPDISQVAYGTSKAAINYLTKLIAVQEARHNIRCNAVLPGMTATDAVKENLTENFKELFLKNTPIRRMGTPEEIAGAVAYFASDDAAYVTGQILDVSGGFGLATPVFGDLADLVNKR